MDLSPLMTMKKQSVSTSTDDLLPRLTPGFISRVIYTLQMIVTSERCTLFTVVRTDMSTGDRVYLTYPPSDYLTAVYRAEHYQRTFDHKRERFDYRVAHHD
jgi:hypothetical protein